MRSAIGNFDSSGTPVDTTQVKRIRFDMFRHRLIACEDMRKGDVIQYEREDGVTTVPPVETAKALLNALNEDVNIVESSVLNVLDYVSAVEWEHFVGLAITMLANGATLYELQQRLMGLE